MRIILVFLILMGSAVTAFASELQGRVIDVDREQGNLVLEVVTTNESVRKVMVESDTIPADIRLGETITVETRSAQSASTIVASRMQKQMGRAGEGQDQTGVRSRLRKAQNGGGNGNRYSGHGSGRGRH